jgi:thiol-disulfide isomerase/thioredoxin
MHDLRPRIRALATAAVLLAALCAAAPAPAQEAPAVPLRPLLPGTAFPAGSHGNLNAGAGGPETIDLSQVLGRKPVVLVYWIPQNPRAEALLQELQAMAAELGDRVAIYGVAVPRPHIPEATIRERIATLGLTLPVLKDENFVIGQRLRVASVPNVSIIDKGGLLRLTNGASLKQVLGYKLTLKDAILRAAETGNLMSYGYLDRYFPVQELEGERCPDFKAPLLTTSVEQRYHSMLDETKLNVLIFWSVDCPHCREYLPEIAGWLKAHPEGVNVVTAATINDETGKTKTREFCELNGFDFPTLIDDNSTISKLYQVTTTPTILIIGPDGVVDTAITSSYTSFAEKIEQKKRELL